MNGDVEKINPAWFASSTARQASHTVFDAGKIWTTSPSPLGYFETKWGLAAYIFKKMMSESPRRSWQDIGKSVRNEQETNMRKSSRQARETTQVSAG